ncbi:hypothetical protein GWK47_016377 [Chionoecetes opilio]|uniref:Uncharacterized protein n=1 Tax=Chionoecetes opilio TaxID=41210 RepID=A0A8J5CMJ7_CHIOP|nr:hypothetical protein GWK47_016377 [Chionoecetes opilio]
MTITKLSRHLICQLTSGTRKSHLLEKHDITITIHFLEENTDMVDMCADVRQLPILEALYIKDNNPKLNVQAHDLQAPPSMKRTKGSDIQPTATQSKEEQKPSTNERRPLRPEAVGPFFGDTGEGGSETPRGNSRCSKAQMFAMVAFWKSQSYVVTMPSPRPPPHQ